MISYMLFFCARFVFYTKIGILFNFYYIPHFIYIYTCIPPYWKCLLPPPCYDVCCSIRHFSSSMMHISTVSLCEVVACMLPLLTLHITLLCMYIGAFMFVCMCWYLIHTYNNHGWTCLYIQVYIYIYISLLTHL